MLGGTTGEVNPNSGWLNSRGMWLSYLIGVFIVHIALLSIPFLTTAWAWTLTSVIHNLVSVPHGLILPSVSVYEMQLMCQYSCNPSCFRCCYFWDFIAVWMLLSFPLLFSSHFTFYSHFIFHSRLIFYSRLLRLLLCCCYRAMEITHVSQSTFTETISCYFFPFFPFNFWNDSTRQCSSSFTRSKVHHGNLVTKVKFDPWHTGNRSMMGPSSQLPGNFWPLLPLFCKFHSTLCSNVSSNHRLLKQVLLGKFLHQVWLVSLRHQSMHPDCSHDSKVTSISWSSSFWYQQVLIKDFGMAEIQRKKKKVLWKKKEIRKKRKKNFMKWAALKKMMKDCDGSKNCEKRMLVMVGWERKFFVGSTHFLASIFRTYTLWY